jgi:isopenicillin N synthase-like dioxygenase
MLRTVIRPSNVCFGVRFTQAHRCLAIQSSPNDTFTIPIIDFHRFLKGTSTEKSQIATQVLDGFTSSGFIYLSNIGVPSSTVSNVFGWSRRFFDLPMEQKVRLAWETPESNRGYVAPGREKVSRLTDEGEIDKIRAKAPDLKESLEIGKEPSENYQVSYTRSRLIESLA